MAINKDFEDLLHHLNIAKAQYLVSGAYAVIFYTQPRYTKDLDIWINPTVTNAKRVYLALKKFGAPLSGLTLKDLTNPLMVYQIGIEPNRIDILMGIGKTDFRSAWKNRRMGRYGKERIFLLHLDDLITSKREAGRPQDKRDLQWLLKKRKKFRNTNRAVV